MLGLPTTAAPRLLLPRCRRLPNFGAQDEAATPRQWLQMRLLTRNKIDAATAANSRSQQRLNNQAGSIDRKQEKKAEKPTMPCHSDNFDILMDEMGMILDERCMFKDVARETIELWHGRIFELLGNLTCPDGLQAFHLKDGSTNIREG